MRLPKQDEEFLTRRGYSWRLVSNGNEVWLIVERFEVTGGGFTPPVTDLMVRLPAGYPLAALDMWYCDPPILLNGTHPNNSDQFEEHGGRRWQRFSRHLGSSWRPGVDGLRSYFCLIEAELQGRGRDAVHAHTE